MAQRPIFNVTTTPGNYGPVTVQAPMVKGLEEPKFSMYQLLIKITKTKQPEGIVVVLKKFPGDGMSWTADAEL